VRRFTLGFALLLIVSACGDTATTATAPSLTIMPIGDSITSGETGWSTYRCYLDGMLRDAGVSFDLVGSQDLPYGGGQYECPAEFDSDHEGYWGAQVSDVVGYTTQVVESLQPDIALIHLGTNDIAFGVTVDETAARLEEFIVGLQAVNPDITILVAQIIPCDTEQANVFFADRCAEELPMFNDAIASFAELSTGDSSVMVVDMETGFSLDDLLDEWHPTEAGDEIIARRWMTALKDADLI
jgi:hypothetical protein